MEKAWSRVGVRLVLDLLIRDSIIIGERLGNDREHCKCWEENQKHARTWCVRRGEVLCNCF